MAPVLRRPIIPTPPWTFEFIVQKTPEHVCGFELTRKPEVQAAYDEHCKRMLETYESTKDYILVRLMGYTGFSTQGPHGSHKMKCLNADNLEARWVLLKNEYPYDLDDGIEHYVFWTTEQAVDLNMVDSKVKENFPDVSRNNLWWLVNEPRLMSMPCVFHAHIFLRSETKQVGRFSSFVDTLLYI